MATNLALGKPASASGYVNPYEPNRAVNGNIAPTSRWLCSRVPAWMRVDLGASYLINGWCVKHMGKAKWQSPEYNLVDYKLQGSDDTIHWTDIDTIINNTQNETTKEFGSVSYRYVRVYVTKGLRTNQQYASFMELEIYQAPPSAYLKNLTISQSTLIPSFVKETFSYTASAVAYDTTSIKITPTAEDGTAVIKVNDAVVPNGQPSSDINLDVGTNTATVKVIAANGLENTYTVSITRKSSPYLIGADVTYATRLGNVVKKIMINKTQADYSVEGIPASINHVTVTPYVEDAEANILVNNTQNLGNAEASSAISLSTTGSTDIPLKVTGAIGGQTKSYTIQVIKQ